MDKNGEIAGLVCDMAKVSSSKAYLKVLGELARSGHFVTPSEERTLELVHMFTVAFAGELAGHIADNSGLLKGLLFPSPGAGPQGGRFSPP